MESQYFCSPNHIPPGSWDRCEQGTACFPTDSVAVLPWKRNSSPGQPLILRLLDFRGATLTSSKVAVIITQVAARRFPPFPIWKYVRSWSQMWILPTCWMTGKWDQLWSPYSPICPWWNGPAVPAFRRTPQLFKGNSFVCWSFGRAQRKKNRSRS